jgi:predicted membrane channel-forming protein YqfA (hemolysin III family)
MKRTVFGFGLLSATVSIAIMAITVPLIYSHRSKWMDVLGYSSVALSALIVFFGIRSYRQKTGSGKISFGRAVAVGVLITLVSAVLYVVAFQVMYFKAAPEYGEKFVSCMVERGRDHGASEQEIAETARKARTLKELYDKPLTNAMVVFGTYFPVGLALSAISAAILRKR